jgi:uncharacterized repeat protein (TIGR01451 family)
MKHRVRVLLAALLLCAAWSLPSAAQASDGAATLAPTASATAVPDPVYPDALSVAASVEPDLMVAPGPAHVSVALTNTGETPIADLRLLRPSGQLVATIGTLEPGASQAFEEDVALSLDQFLAGGVTYLIRCTLYPGTPEEIAGHSTVTAPLERIPAQPGAEFSRSVSSEYVQAGEQVTLTYRVVNTGNVPLIELLVSDPLVGDVGALPELAPGQKHTFTARVSVNADAESQPSLSCFSKADPDAEILKDLGATRIHVTDQRLEASLSADSAAVRSGEPVTLRLKLYNASDIALEKLRVYDQTGAVWDSPAFSLKPGERYELTQPVQMRQTTTLLLTVSGRTEGGSAFSTRSNALTVAVQASPNRARITLSAQVNPNTPVAPGTVRFSLRLVNTGEDSLHCVNLSEQSRGSIRTLWVVPPGETVIEQDYPIGGKPFVFLAEMADDKGGRLTVLSSPVTVEAAAQPVAPQATPAPVPALSGTSYRMPAGPGTFLMMMIGVTAVLLILVAIFAAGGVRKRRMIEKQRRIHIKRIRRSMREPKQELSQETRPVPVVRRSDLGAGLDDKRAQ